MEKKQQQAVFDHWIDDHKGILFKVIRIYAFTKDDQEDLFQEIALQVWKSIPNFREACAVTTWLYRISLNTAIKWIKKEQKHSAQQEDLIQENSVLAIHQSTDPRLAWLYEQIAELETIDRSLTLLLLDGLSYKEMANIVGISENYVGVKINRIKKYLAEKSNSYHNGI